MAPYALPAEPSGTQPTDPKGPTGQVCSWVNALTLDDVPPAVRERAKYLILDGVACALVGAKLPWSKTAADAIFDIEPPGNCHVWGWEKKVGPLAAALLNSTFLQGFELDDYHSEAPLHSNSLLLPAMLAAVEHGAGNGSLPAELRTGTSFLLAAIAGYEIGPRVGLGLNGAHMLTTGWHSGAVFGPPAVAVATSKLHGMTAALMEDAMGIACTQAGGLMSAQFESDSKRMQHGFASRNGLLATFLARGGYVGIKRVLERPYGGFLNQFSLGSGMDPQYRPNLITEGLGQHWKIETITVKPYAAMAGTHCTVDCIRKLQEVYPQQMKKFENMKSIKVEMQEAAFKHGGWVATRPLTTTGAQMSVAYVAAVQLLDGQVLAAQFAASKLDRDSVWDLVEKIECIYNDTFKSKWAQRVTIEFDGGLPTLVQMVQTPRGVDPALSNDEIVQKWRGLMSTLIDDERRKAIEDLVLGIEKLDDVRKISDLLAGKTDNPIS